MANLGKGFKRMAWILSVAGAIVWWIVVFSGGNFKLGIDPAGVRLINSTDKEFLRAGALSDQGRGDVRLSELRKRPIGGYKFNELRKSFPTLNIEMLRIRYLSAPETGIDSATWHKAANAEPETFFTNKIFYGKIAITFLSGFIPFLGIWLVWFLVRWGAAGFTNTSGETNA